MAIGDEFHLTDEPDKRYWQNVVSGTTTNSELIDFLELSVDSNRTIDDASFSYLESCISPKNCLGLTVLAKQFHHAKLATLCKEYALLYFDAVVTEKSLKSLTVNEFEKSLDSSGLPTQKKMEMIAVYWAAFWKSPGVIIDGDAIRQEKGEFSSILDKLRELVMPNLWLDCCLLSPKNCIPTAVLIKMLGNDYLIKRMEEYITECMNAVAANGTFLSLSKPVLERSLEICQIPTQTKAKLIMHWAQAYPDDRMDDAMGMLFKKVPGDVDSSVRNVMALFFKKVTAGTAPSQVLKDFRSTDNYRHEIDFIANECRFGLMKIPLDRFLTRNSHTIELWTTGIDLKEDNSMEMKLSSFPKNMRIPKREHCTFKIEQSKTDLAANMNNRTVKASKDVMKKEKDTVQFKSYHSEYSILERELSLLKKSHLRKTPLNQEFVMIEQQATDQELLNKDSEQRLTGGEPKGSLILDVDEVMDDEHDEEKSNQKIMEMFVERRKKKAFKTDVIGPKGGVLELFGCCLKFPNGALNKEKQITISVDNNPENYPKDSFVVAPIFGIEPSMSFAKPIVVRMRTWFRSLDGETKMATVFSRREGSDWTKVDKVPLRSTNEIEFPVWHLSDTAVAVPESDSSNGIHTLKNRVYIHHDACVIQSHFYQSKKDEHDVNSAMWEKSFATFTSQCINIEGKLGDIVKVRLELTSPEEKGVSGKSWRESESFTIKKVYKSGIYTIQAKLGRPSFNCFVEGNYDVFLGQKLVASAFLASKRSVTLNPLVQPMMANDTNSVVNTSGSGPIAGWRSERKNSEVKFPAIKSGLIASSLQPIKSKPSLPNMEVPAERIVIVGPTACSLNLYGFKLDFPEGALGEDTEITVSVDNNPKSYPTILSSDTVLPIAPVLGLKPSVKFAKPVVVKIPTWISAAEGQEVDAVLLFKKLGFDWKEVPNGKIPLDCSNQIELSVEHFCKVNLVVRMKDARKIVHTILNNLFIQEDSGMMQSTFYLSSEKTESDIRNNMLNKSFSSFCGKTLKFKCKVDDRMKISASITEPEERSTDMESSEVKVEDVVNDHVYDVQFEADLELRNFDGVIKGRYSVLCNSDEKRARLHRKWPIKPDRQESVIKVDKITSTVGSFVGDNGILLEINKDIVKRVQSSGS